MTDSTEEEYYKLTPKGALFLLLDKMFKALSYTPNYDALGDLADEFEASLAELGFVIMDMDNLRWEPKDE